jgi:uncharacterized membrane protein
MGVADIIPGVSGGTMALVLGIYSRLLLSIRYMDLGLLKCISQKAFYVRTLNRLRSPLATPSEDPVLARADALAFLVVLVLGILSAIVTAAKFIPGWMAEYPEVMRGFFFGLIIVSIAAPARQMKAPNWAKLTLPILLTAALTFVLLGGNATDKNFATGTLLLEVSSAPDSPLTIDPGTRFVGEQIEELGKHGQALRPKTSIEWPEGATELQVPVIAIRAGVDGNDLVPSKSLDAIPGIGALKVSLVGSLSGGASPPLWAVFLAGAIAICAMILPGVSGAFLLLLMGQYDYVLYHLRGALGGSGDSAVVLVVFLVGITIGILAFSRVLSALLSRAHDETMAILMGLMMGSLGMLWPYQGEGGTLLAPGDGASFTPIVAMATGSALIGIFLFLDNKNRRQQTSSND